MLASRSEWIRIHLSWWIRFQITDPDQRVYFAFLILKTDYNETISKPIFSQFLVSHEESTYTISDYLKIIKIKQI